MHSTVSVVSSLSLIALLSANAGQGGSGGCADDGPPLPATLEVVARFDPAKGELPEGLTMHRGAPTVGLAVLGQARSVTADGQASTVATSPTLPPNQAFVTGLASYDDRLYLAVPSFSPELPAGLYRTAPGGGAATRFTSGAAMVFPSDVERDARGDFYVSDSMAGAIFKVGPDGEATVWVADPLLQGGRAICGNTEGLFDIGANGMVVRRDSVLVVNTDRGSLIEIPIRPDGAAGAPRERIASNCEELGGADGLVQDLDGSLYVAINRQNKIVRITRDDEFQVIYQGGELDFPASVRIATIDGVRWLYVTNFALGNALGGKPALPSLARIRLSR